MKCELQTINPVKKVPLSVCSLTTPKGALHWQAHSNTSCDEQRENYDVK